jgi:PAS domain S-box-containing protein
MIPPRREWQAILTFVALLVVTDRLSNLIPDLRPFDQVIFVFLIFGLACWSGLRSALINCGMLVAYVWTVYHVPHLSIVARAPDPSNKMTMWTAILFPPFALIGGLVNRSVRRAAIQVVAAHREVEYEAERRRAVEAELWASEGMQRLIVDSSMDAVIGIAPDLTVSLWSPNAERLFGWSRAEAIGQPAAVRLVAPVPNDRGETDLLPGLRSAALTFLRQTIDTAALTKSGERVAVELYVADHPSESGPMYLVFARDISKRKRDERVIAELNRDLMELNVTLEARVAERTRQLEAANEELLGFTYSVSHDLRAPLRSIVSNSRMVSREARNALDEENLTRLGRLEGSALKMARLIDDLLQHARVGRLKLEPSEIDLSAMAGRIGEDLKVHGPGAVSIQPGIEVYGDPEMIEIVLTNLMENAWKYVPPGQPPCVEVGATDDGAVFVRDRGIGFDMKYEGKLWEPFERLHHETEYPGTGIGLANSKRIVLRHGGRIWAESEPGRGTTMYFDLGRPAKRGATAKLI